MNEKVLEKLLEEKASKKRIPEGQDPQEFREKVARALEGAPMGSRRKAVFRKALAEVDKEIEAEADGEEAAEKAPKDPPETSESKTSSKASGETPLSAGGKRSSKEPRRGKKKV